MGLAGKTAPSFYRKMNRKKHVYRVISLVSLLVMAAAILSIVYMLFLYRQSNRAYLELAQAARERAEAQAAEALAPPETETPEPPAETEQPDAEKPEYAVIPVDFDYLTGLNEDIAGWIEVEGTAVDYPILYDATPTRFYLNHTHIGAYSPYGSVFMLSENARDFSDFNTVVYGHNMLDGSMFASLHNFEDQTFFDEHDTIMVYLPGRVLCYRVFAAYRTDNLNQIVNFPTDTPGDRQAYIDRIYTHTEKAIFNPDIEVTPDDRIITLSTCIANPAYRYLVQGVLISDREGISATAPVG